MSDFYQSKTVFLSGASRGLGHELAKQLLNHDIKALFVTAQTKEALLPLADMDSRVKPIAMQLSSAESINGAVEVAKESDMVIHNAGILHFGNVLTMPIEEIEKDIQVNHIGSLRLIRAFYPHLISHRSSHLLSILSIVSLASKAGIGGYATSKAAAYSAMQSIRGTLSKEGVNVHTAFPAGMDTDMLAPVISEEKDEPEMVASEILAQLSLGQMDIFPGHAKPIGEQWLENPRQLQKQFTGV